MIPAWIEANQEAEIRTGLDIEEALQRALELRDRLRKKPSAASFPIEVESVETLHAFCALLDQPYDMEPTQRLADCSAAFDFVSALKWPSREFGGPQDLLSRLAFLRWSAARRAADSEVEQNSLDQFRKFDDSGTAEAVRHVLSTPIARRQNASLEIALRDPETLLRISQLLWSRSETSPAIIREEAVFFHELLSALEKEADSADERNYFLGDFALIAGGVCRLLSRRGESTRWFDRAEAYFALGRNASAHLGRVAYQRLALRVEEHGFGEVLELAPLWAESLSNCGLKEESLKCRFLEALSLWELGDLRTAIRVFLQLGESASAIGSLRLEAQAANNAAILFGVLGEAEKALEQAQKALPLLLRLEDRVGLAKLQWGIGNLLRAQHRPLEAIEAFRFALNKFSEIGMRGDVAALHLIIADLLLETDQDREAEREVRAALPIIEEEEMVPEGTAALSILRDSLRRRPIDRQALKRLPGYFRNTST